MRPLVPKGILSVRPLVPKGILSVRPLVPKGILSVRQIEILRFFVFQKVNSSFHDKYDTYQTYNPTNNRVL